MCVNDPAATPAPLPASALPRGFAGLLILVAAASYGLAFATRWGGAAVLLALPCIFLLARLKSARAVFLAGLFCGVAMYAPQLWFFWSIFHAAAIALWLIAALPVGIFTLLVYHARRRFGLNASMWLTPVIWTGLEFFRSELYYLRFSWIAPGQAVAFLPGVRLMFLGVYGLSFLMAIGASLLIARTILHRAIGAAILLTLGCLIYLPASSLPESTPAPLHVAGVQLEFPTPNEAAAALDHLATVHPEAQILVLSEYSFEGTVPEVVRDVLRKHSCYLIAGGIANFSDGQFRDTAFVIGPDGGDLFSQCKSVPVQFMSDGLPAEDRQVWNSPWGKIGIAICYDIGYARVMDDFIRAGARGLIIPTMDLESWGHYEREMLHGRLAPIRAAEYGVPVFGVWSSGESQLIDGSGRIIATGGYPGQGEMIAGPFDMPESARVPRDRWLAMGATLLTGALAIYFMAVGVKNWMKQWRQAKALH